MGTLFIDRKNLEVRLDPGNALAFYAGGVREGAVPLNPLKRVVIVGNVTVEASVLHRFADSGISVLFLSGRRSRFCGSLCGRLHNNGLLRLRQYDMMLGPEAGDIAREIAARKITEQARLLDEAAEQRPDLRFPITQARRTMDVILGRLSAPQRAPEGMAVRLTKETIRGLEGAASAAYFSAFNRLFAPSLSFDGRNRRPPKDPVNALLSLCYTLLHFEVVREIEVIGLDPTLGFLHDFEYGRESLASDLVEIFRASVDRFVWTVFREREFRENDFAHDVERPGCYLKKGGRKRFYPLYEEWARQERPQITAEVRGLAHRITDGDCDEEPETLELRNRTRTTEAAWNERCI